MFAGVPKRFGVSCLLTALVLATLISLEKARKRSLRMLSKRFFKQTSGILN